MIILFIEMVMHDAVIIDYYFSRVTKRQYGNLVHTGDILGSRKVGDN